MPLYDYRCENCSHEFEALQQINQAPLTECPICTEHALKKQASAPTFTFKGGGWYKDGYGSANAEKPAKSNSDSSGDKKSGADVKSGKSNSGKSDTGKATTEKASSASSSNSSAKPSPK